MFFGTYAHALDEKGRIRIPSKLKAGITGCYVITKGIDNCLYIFNKTYFETEFLSKLDSVFPYATSGNKSVRAILGSTFDVEEDTQGRFVIPAPLKEFAGIDKNVVSVGVGNRVEIWDSKKWSNYSNQASFEEAVRELNSTK